LPPIEDWHGFFLKKKRMRVTSVFLIVLLGFGFMLSAQKPQRVAYIDMNYILENIPEYQNAQSQLNSKVKKWQEKLDGLSAEIDQLKTDLSNEKPLLTSELIREREEDIDIKEQELKRLQQAYFGPTGDLFQLRKQLATPVQDQVYNAIQDISKKKRYDFVFDRSSDLIMLYSNPKFDISELVLNSIVKNRKRQAIQDMKNERIAKAGAAVPPTVLEGGDEAAEEEEAVEAATGEEIVTDGDAEVEVQKTEEQLKLEERIRKREELKARIKEQQEARARMRDSLKQVAEEKRAAKLKEIEERKKQREQAIQNNN
jgi:Skp family chaperone for outer membrane proteins